MLICLRSVCIVFKNANFFFLKFIQVQILSLKFKYICSFIHKIGDNYIKVPKFYILF